MSFEPIVLSNGGLRFSALAAGDGPVVLLLHGFPDTALTFSHQIKALAQAGYRAVAVTMRGYEPSSQPADGDYHAVRMAEDVVAWAGSLSDIPVHLVGHDWGANIAYAAAAHSPQRFKTLTTLAVPHPVRFGEAYAVNPEQQRRSAYILEFQASGFEEQISSGDCAYLERLWRSWSPHWDIPADLLNSMKSTFRGPGVAKAALEYYRQGFDVVSVAGQETAALFSRTIEVPTLGLCGSDDECIPPDVFLPAMRTNDFPVALEVAQVDRAGHFLHAEAPAAVNGLLLDWLATKR